MVAEDFELAPQDAVVAELAVEQKAVEQFVVEHFVVVRALVLSAQDCVEDLLVVVQLESV